MDPKHHYFLSALKLADVRYFIASTGTATIASRALAVVIGFQIYQITRSPLALGWLGLIEAIPAISFAFFGGYVADHFDRYKILVISRAFSAVCALGLFFISKYGSEYTLAGLYTIIFLIGVARGFADPAATAFEAQIVPKHLTVNASSWISSTWISCSVIGPAMIGFAFDAWGAANSYLIIALFFVLGWLSMIFVRGVPNIIPTQKEPVLKSIRTGWNAVTHNQPLFAAMSLDLFAVLFGGAIALLPIYAEKILQVGASGLGLLNAAPSLGALIIMLTATHRPPIENAGRNLLFTVAGFGIAMIIFAFSKNFWLSMFALFISGIFDGVSVVIRRSMIRLLSPDHLRGRIAAVNSIFICSSNELGAFESGMLAALIGTVPCVAVGGFTTLAVVAACAVFAPQLRRLKFDIHTLEQK